MPHEVSLISTIAIGFALAFALGFVANWLRMPPLVGYLLAGVAIGPFTPGFVADAGLAGQLAEIGVMLLMFGVGLHFSGADLMAVRRIAVPGAILEIMIATAIGTVATRLWGWTLGQGLVLGLCLSVASTVVVLRALEDRKGLATANGRIAVGWLIVEDLAMVLTLVLLPALAETLGGHAPGNVRPAGLGLAANLALTLLKVASFVALSLLVGPRLLPWILRQVARTGSRELFTLSVLTVSLGIAFTAARLFGVSFALGAFFAGLVLNESQLSHKAAANVLPMQDAFAVLFFISVGMLFDPSILVRHPGMVAVVLVLILVGKSMVALGIALGLGYPLSTALSLAAALPQIGEFSFILAGLGLSYGLLPPEGVSLILAGSIIAITLNPLAFAWTDWVHARVQANPALRRRWEESRSAPLERLEQDLQNARLALEKKAAAHRTFTPEELVERFPLFAGLTADQRETLILHFHARDAQPGERIIRKGDKPDAAYFISSGEVEVSVAKQKIKLGAGNFFGEMALLSGQLRMADVTALDYTRLLLLRQGDFRTLLRRYPELRAQIAAQARERGEMNRHLHEAALHEGASPE